MTVAQNNHSTTFKHYFWFGENPNNKSRVNTLQRTGDADLRF